jgi:hypothetical protein
VKRKALIAALGLIVLMAWWHFTRRPTAPVPAPPPGPPPDVAREAVGRVPTAAEALLSGYGDPDQPPAEDLRKLLRVLAGYFSVVKEPSRHPIGGNEDLAAALRGENPNREVFLPADHPVFSADGLLIDRWGTPLAVHPEAWKELELRSAGPDRRHFTADDLVLAPAGFLREVEK